MIKLVYWYLKMCILYCNSPNCFFIEFNTYSTFLQSVIFLDGTWRHEDSNDNNFVKLGNTLLVFCYRMHSYNSNPWKCFHIISECMWIVFEHICFCKTYVWHDTIKSISISSSGFASKIGNRIEGSILLLVIPTCTLAIGFLLGLAVDVLGKKDKFWMVFG